MTEKIVLALSKPLATQLNAGTQPNRLKIIPELRKFFATHAVASDVRAC